jgi:hypothetical protein
MFNVSIISSAKRFEALKKKIKNSAVNIIIFFVGLIIFIIVKIMAKKRP